MHGKALIVSSTENHERETLPAGGRRRLVYPVGSPVCDLFGTRGLACHSFYLTRQEARDLPPSF